MILARQVAGAVLVILSTAPIYRLLPGRSTGLAGAAIAGGADTQAALLWSALLLAAIPAILVGLFAEENAVTRTFEAVGRALTRWPDVPFALALGLVSAGLTTLVTAGVFHGEPNLLDTVAQLTHARYMAAGQLGGPADATGGFWHIGNAVRTDAGWFSQYPPGHVMLLAASLALDAPWLAGAFMMGATAALSVLTFQRLLPGREALARAASLGVAFSPFLVAQSAAFMSHSTAAALSLLAVYAALRGRDGRASWAALAGASAGALAAVRPLTGVLMAGIAALAWLAPPGRRRLPGLIALAVAGGMPFVLAQLWYNHVAFGHWATFGYDAAWGPSHGLGFHLDPWGNAYGPVEALLYTGADLTALNLNLLEIPLPLVTMAGAFLLLARRALTPGERLLAIWALSAVAANAFYWHHGHFMGPRMLADAAPAWIGLAAVSVAGLVALVPRITLMDGRFSPRAAALGLVAAGIVGGLLLGPQRLMSHGASADDAAELAPPDAPAGSLVFVHGSWESRLASQLAHAGVRLDVVEAALQQNPTCLVQLHLGEMRSAAAFGQPLPMRLPALDLTPASREFLPRIDLADGSRVRHDPAMPLAPACRREVIADRFGARDASYLLWRGDLPGAEVGRVMFARDLGPELNARLIARHPDRPAFMHARFDSLGTWQLRPYAEGSARLWSP